MLGLRTASKGSWSADQNQTRAYCTLCTVRASRSHPTDTDGAQRRILKQNPILRKKVGELAGLKAFNLNIPDLCPVSFRRQPAVKFHLIAGEKCVSANADCEARPRGPPESIVCGGVRLFMCNVRQRQSVARQRKQWTMIRYYDKLMSQHYVLDKRSSSCHKTSTAEHRPPPMTFKDAYAVESGSIFIGRKARWFYYNTGPPLLHYKVSANRDYYTFTC
uniref:SFRICE_007881 n=1 Tax=Spodoptera frugiperda TaxID=7108 RepID=A0A2H1VJ52_SPOFR